jgi:hypothetical protein
VTGGDQQVTGDRTGDSRVDVTFHEPGASVMEGDVVGEALGFSAR